MPVGFCQDSDSPRKTVCPQALCDSERWKQNEQSWLLDHILILHHKAIFRSNCHWTCAFQGTVILFSDSCRLFPQSLLVYRCLRTLLSPICKPSLDVAPLSKTGSHYFPVVNMFKIKLAIQLPIQDHVLYMEKNHVFNLCEMHQNSQRKAKCLKILWESKNLKNLSKDWFFSKLYESFNISMIHFFSISIPRD